MSAPATREPVRMCECGCKRQALKGSKYAEPERCRRRAYRARVEREMAAAGLPSRPSLKLAHSAQHPQLRIGDSEKPRQRRQGPCRDGVQIYLRDPALAERTLEEIARIVDERGDEDLRPVTRAITKGLQDRERRLQRRAEQRTAEPAAPAAAPIACVDLGPQGPQQPCPWCNGSGVCPTCHGDGTVPLSTALTTPTISTAAVDGNGGAG